MASLRALSTTLLLAALTQGRPLTGAAAPAKAKVSRGVMAEDCDCYKATTNSTAYFANRKFFDFRAIANPSTPAPIAAGQAADAAAGYTHPYFSAGAWADTWALQSWAAAGEGVKRVNSLNNVYIAADDDDGDGEGQGGGGTYLTLRTQRQADYQSTAEIESKDTDYQFLTMRMMARTKGASGAVTALFTYAEEGGGSVQEADIEIRTSTASNVVQYTNQPGSNPDATSAATIAGAWTDWREHRYDWTPGSSEWFVDGVRVAAIQAQTPTAPLSVLMNTWSDGGVWSGAMAVGGEAEMQVRWLDVTFNSTAQAGAGTCGQVCVVDDLVKK
ncbi:concanavalin A-like lectin/glucanase domain-containing protein [Nemania diffusa]|nr:concanavalin A-like lectin/glucanase domain-containing protein [Nemania diffusa]